MKVQNIIPNHKIADYVADLSPAGIRSDIGATLEKLLDGSDNKAQKIDLLKKKVLDDQHVKNLSKPEWTTILTNIMTGIYQYIDDDSSEGQDILNLFFIAFNKYTGKADIFKKPKCQLFREDQNQNTQKNRSADGDRACGTPNNSLFF